MKKVIDVLAKIILGLVAAAMILFIAGLVFWLLDFIYRNAPILFWVIMAAVAAFLSGCWLEYRENNPEP